MPKIILANQTFLYTLKRRRGVSLSIKLLSPKSFQVSCPHLLPEMVISRFIRAHEEWILKNAAKLSPRKNILDQKQLGILDVIYKLIIIKTARDTVIINEKEQIICVNTCRISNTHVKSLLDTRLRRLALILINSELRSLQKQYGFKYGRVTVRNQKTRYGSCSSTGNLNFNWQIIFFPEDKFRHILLHELTHLKIRNHQAEFWRQLSVYDPEAKINNLWLKKEGIKYFL